MKARLKIAYILPSLEVGGSEKQVVEMATRLDRNRFEAQLVCLRAGSPEWERAIANRVRLKVFAFKDSFRSLPANLPQLYKLAQYLEGEKPHLVHTFFYWPAIFGVLAARVAGTPAIISSRRNISYFETYRPYRQWLQNVANLFTDTVLANSQAVKQDVLRRERINPAKLKVIYNGCDWERFENPKADRALTRRELGIRGNEVLVGIVASLHPNKGQEVLLQAMPHILPHFPAVKLLLVGRDREYRATLESLASSLKIQDKVIFTGEREDIPELLKAMDVGTLCSLYSEGFSNAVLEMMAAGLPVVATDVGGNREAIVDGETGLLVPPGDSSKLAEAILRLLRDRELASRMGAAAHERVRKLFSMERMIEETEQLYVELLRAKSPTAARYVR